MIFLKIAVLNIHKHFKRTIVIIFAVTLSVIIMEFVSGMSEGMREGFFSRILKESGHLQIHEKGWEDRVNPYSITYTVTSPDKIINEIDKNDNVIKSEKIITFGALLLKEEENIRIIGQGVSPNSIFFKEIEKDIIEGEFLPMGRGILISKRNAELLNIGINSKAMVLVSDSYDDPLYMEYTVTGIFETDSRDFDDDFFFIGFDNASDLLSLDGSATEIRIALKDKNLSGRVKEDIQGLLKKEGLLALTWQEINGSFISLFELFDFFMLFINIFIFIVAATVITNTILMIQFERIREFGTLRAIGLKNAQLFNLILTEGLIQGFAGSLLGLFIGIPIVLFFQKNGLDWGKFTESLKMGNSLKFSYSVKNSFQSLVSGILIVLAASLYAGFVNTRIKLINMLKHI